MRAILGASRRLPPRSEVIRDEQFGWCIATPDAGLLAIDTDLIDLARFGLPHDALGSHGVRPDLTLAVVSCKARVVAIDPAEDVIWQMPHPPWGRHGSERGSCWFSADGRYVWAHIPTVTGPDEWVVIGAADGSVAGRAPLACSSAGSRTIRHPDGRRVGLSVGEGQDGSETYVGRMEGGVLVVDRLDDRSRVLASFSPDGSSYLTTPHTSGPIQIHRVDDGAIVASLDPDAAFDGDVGFDLFGGFVEAGLVMFTADDRDEVFVARAPKFDAIETIDLSITRAGELVEAYPGGFLTMDHLTGETNVWRIVT